MKSYHLTLAYQFQPQHYAGLQDLAAAIDPEPEDENSGWELRIYSYEDRMRNHDVFKVRYAYSPGQEDELELRIGDFVYVLPEEIKTSVDGWVFGTSWLTGCQGYLPKVRLHYEKCRHVTRWRIIA